MNHLKPTVIVLSRNYSTGLGVIRALGAAGYPVDLIASVKKKGSSVIASSSRYVRESTEVLTRNIQGNEGKELLDALMQYTKTHKEPMVIFPADDFTAAVADANRTRLEPYFLMPHTAGSFGLSVTDYMDKTRQAEMAEAAGLLTPRSWMVSLKGDLMIPEDVVYPCFVKPIESISGHKTEMAVCTDAPSLKAHLAGMQEFFRSRSVLIQEYLSIDREYDFSGVCLDQEIIIPGIIEKSRIARYELGVTMAGTMLPPAALGEALEQVKALLKSFHYTGMFDMELNLCGGKLYFNEVNFRSGGPNFAYYLNGVNLPALFVKAVTGEICAGEKTEISAFGKTFVYEKVAWEDYIHGYMTRKELDACLEQADFTLLANREDPAPGRHFQRRIRLSTMKHRAKVLLGKAHRAPAPQQKQKAQDNSCCAVIIGRNYGNILTMTRDLGEAGYTPAVLRVYKKKPNPLNLMNRMKPDALSRYVHTFCECIAGEEPEQVIHCLRKLGPANGQNKMLLIPVDDYTAQLVDEHLTALQDCYLLPNISGKAGKISALMDKHRQKLLAADYGLPMLPSVLIQSQSGQFEIPEGIQYPCFIKPNVSSKSTKASMKKCSSEEELRSTLNGYAKAADFELLVEAFADIRAEYSLLGLSTPKGTIAPGAFRATRGGHRERKGVALTGETVSCAELNPVVNQCIDFVKSLNYTGMFDIDLIETVGGDLYFVELNFRAGASMRAFTACGLNMPAMYADCLLQGKAPDLDAAPAVTGKHFVSEKILIEEFLRSDISAGSARKLMDEAEIYFVKDDKDPKPYAHFKRFYGVARLMRMPYRLRDRKKRR